VGLEPAQAGGGAQVLEALEHAVELAVVQLLGLDQDLLADADLAEVVEEAGVLDLPQLLRREADVAEGGQVAAVDDLGEGDGEVGDPLAVAAGGRVALLDGRDAGSHEAFERAWISA
jgi:hypothetical protein